MENLKLPTISYYGDGFMWERNPAEDSYVDDASLIRKMCGYTDNIMFRILFTVVGYDIKKTIGIPNPSGSTYKLSGHEAHCSISNLSVVRSGQFVSEMRDMEVVSVEGGYRIDRLERKDEVTVEDVINNDTDFRIISEGVLGKPEFIVNKEWV